MTQLLPGRLVPAPDSGVFSYVPVPVDDFAEFYEASYGRVVALVAAVVGDRHQAEDIAQEAFARALTRPHRAAPGGRDADDPHALRRAALRSAVDQPIG